jgi:WD40 repeat protein
LPDGTPVIVSGSDDGTVRVWRLEDGTPLARPLDLSISVGGIALHGNIIVTAAGDYIAVHQPIDPRSARNCSTFSEPGRPAIITSRQGESSRCDRLALRRPEQAADKTAEETSARRVTVYGYDGIPATTASWSSGQGHHHVE